MSVCSFPPPVADNIRLSKVTGTALGLSKLICNTTTPVAPACSLWLIGEFVPTLTDITGGVGLKVMVGVSVNVAVGERVPV
jgi:hypothetical protein